jgi:predicted DNA-binding transcriptional regulator AlpA
MLRIPQKEDETRSRTLARPQMLKLPEVLEEIGMSRAAFYRMRARDKAPKLIKLPNGQLRCRRDDLDAWWSSMEDAA